MSDPCEKILKFFIDKPYNCTKIIFAIYILLYLIGRTTVSDISYELGYSKCHINSNLNWMVYWDLVYKDTTVKPYRYELRKV